MSLHLFDVFGGGEEVVIAETEDDARAIMLELVSAEDLAGASFVRLDDARPYKVRLGEDEEAIEKTCGEWAAQFGRGHFCSSYA